MIGMGLILVLLNGCITVAQVTTLSEEACHHKMRDELESILTEEHEKPDVANRLAVNTTTVLATGALGPRRFGVSSPSGVDYSFFYSAKATIVCCGSIVVERDSLATRTT